MQCPALTAALLLAVGVLLGSRTDVTTPTLFALAAVIWGGLALILAIRGTDDRWGLWAVVLVILCGAVRGKQSTHDPAPRLVDAHPVQPFEGIVRASPEPRPKGSRVPIDLRFVGPALLPAKGTVLVRFRDFVPDLNAGDRVRVDAALEMPPVARNAGAFDYAAYLRRRGIQRTARVKHRGQIQVTEIGQGAYGVRAIAAIRNHVSEGIRRNLSGAPSAVLQGVLLGDRSALDDDVRTAFTRAGVAHVLAVSGLHVGLIAAGAFFTLRVVGCGRRVTGCLTLLLVWCYALVTGGSASVVRAATMATTVLGGGLFDREGNALNGLGFAAFVPSRVASRGSARREVPAVFRRNGWHPSVLPSNPATHADERSSNRPGRVRFARGVTGLPGGDIANRDGRFRCCLDRWVGCQPRRSAALWSGHRAWARRRRGGLDPVRFRDVDEWRKLAVSLPWLVADDARRFPIVGDPDHTSVDGAADGGLRLLLSSDFRRRAPAIRVPVSLRRAARAECPGLE